MISYFIYFLLNRWQGDYNGQVKKWFPVNFTEETVMKAKPEPTMEVSHKTFSTCIYKRGFSNK